MSDNIEYDVVIIGAGVAGGCPAAAYLQKAGAKVLMVEANDVPGIHCHSYTFHGASCTPCAGGFAGGTMPAWEDLELESFGAKFLIAPRAFGMIFPDNTSLFLGGPDPETTLKEIAQFSEKDAATFGNIMKRTLEKFLEVCELFYYSPPSGDNLNRLYELMAYVAGMSVEDFSRMDSWEFLDYLFEDHRIKQALIQPSTSSMVMADPNKKGEGAMGILAPFFLGAGQLQGSNQKWVDSMVSVFEHFGGTLWLDSPVDRVVVENGVATGIQMSNDSEKYPGQVISAKHAVISNTGAIMTHKLIGDETLRAIDPNLAAKMKYWDNHSRPSTVTVWVLNKPVQWKGAEKNPYLKRADWVYVGKDSFKDWREWHDALLSNQGDEAFQGWWECFTPALIDPGLASEEGYVTFRVEAVLPYWLRSEDGGFDPEKWEKHKWDLVKQREDVFERLAPGFKDSIVEVVMADSPLDLWKKNRTAVYGCAQGGAFTADQSYLSRMPYRMPIEKLYMSNSAWPASLTWCGTGYIAACIVAEEMGIREQSWWKSRPGEWLLKNMPRLMKDSVSLLKDAGIS